MIKAALSRLCQSYDKLKRSKQERMKRKHYIYKELFYHLAR
jgi:hypothetical protein